MVTRNANARPLPERRAFSLLELTAVVAILGLLAGAAAMRWGDNAVRTATTQGYVRSLVMSLHLARKQAISTGDPGAVVLNRTGGVVTSISVVRVTGGGDTPTDADLETPEGVVITPSADRFEYDYTGVLTAPSAGGTIGVADGDWTWTLTANAATGHVQIVKSN